MRLMQMMPLSRSFAREMNRLHQELEQAFGAVTSKGNPALNLWEDENSFHVETELPGYDASQIEAFIVGNEQLVIKGERSVTSYDKAVCHRQERTAGCFERTITLPKPVNGDNVQAKFTHGVLHLTLAKSPEAKPKKIEIAIN